MNTSELISLVVSISSIILTMLFLVLIKVITSFSTKNVTDTFNISKGFVRKVELTEFKNEMRQDMAVERVALQELVMQQLNTSIDNKVKELRNIGNKLISVDEMINDLELLKDDFKDKIASFNLVNDELVSIRKDVNQIKYGTDVPSEETISRRKG